MHWDSNKVPFSLLASVLSVYISSFVSVLKLSKASLTARKQTFGPRDVFSIKWRLSSRHFILQTCWRWPPRYVKDCTMHEHLSPIDSRHRKQRQRWRRGRQKWQAEVDILSLSVFKLGTFVQRDLKQRHSDSLCVRQKRSIKRDIAIHGVRDISPSFIGESCKQATTKFSFSFYTWICMVLRNSSA